MRKLALVPRENARPEGPSARAVEPRTSRWPSDLFLWAAGGSIAAAVTMKLFHRDDDAQFVGQWAPTLLLLGLYRKLARQFGPG